MQYTRKLPEKAARDCADESCAERLSLLAYQTVHAEDSTARVRAYQNGVRSFTLDELQDIGTNSPDLYVRYDARMRAYLKQTDYSQQIATGLLEQRLQAPRAEHVNRELIKPKEPAKTLKEAAGDNENHEYREAM